MNAPMRVFLLFALKVIRRFFLQSRRHRRSLASFRRKIRLRRQEQKLHFVDGLLIWRWTLDSESIVLPIKRKPMLTILRLIYYSLS